MKHNVCRLLMLLLCAALLLPLCACQSGGAEGGEASVGVTVGQTEGEGDIPPRCSRTAASCA